MPSSQTRSSCLLLCRKFFHMLLQCGERSEWTISKVPRTLTSRPRFAIYVGFSILMLIYKPLVPPRMLRMAQNEVLKETAGDGKVIPSRKMK